MGEEKYRSTDLTSTLNDFRNFVDKVSDTLQAPVILQDAHNRLLAHSKHDNVTSLVRIQTIMTRQIPEKVVDYLWKHGVMLSLLECEQPIRINVKEIGLENRVAVCIRDQGEVLGYIWVIEGDSPLCDEAIEYLSKAAKGIRLLISQYYSSMNKADKSHKNLFWQLLLGNIKSHQEIKKKLYDMNIHPYKLCTVAVFRLLEEAETTLHHQIMDLLRSNQQVKVLFHIFNGKDLIALVSMAPEKCSVQALDSFVGQFMHLTKERLGISFTEGVYGGVYEEYNKIDLSYVEALTVLDMKEQLPREIEEIWGYGNLGMYKYINILKEARKKHDGKNFFLERICEYDNKHNQQLLKTLEIYLDHDCNTFETANALYIHTNTLNYRLKRIREIGDIPLNDFNQKIGIYIDLKTKKLLKEDQLN